jgi:hypothetical protein
MVNGSVTFVYQYIGTRVGVQLIQVAGYIFRIVIAWLLGHLAPYCMKIEVYLLSHRRKSKSAGDEI